MPFSKWLSQKMKQTQVTTSDQEKQELPEQKINGNVEDTIAYLHQIFGGNSDFSMRRFHVFGKYSAVMFYYSNMIDQSNVNTDILKPFMLVAPKTRRGNLDSRRLTDILINETLYHSEAVLENRLSSLSQKRWRKKGWRTLATISAEIRKCDGWHGC